LRTPDQTLNQSQIAGVLAAEALAASAAGLFVNEHSELGIGSVLRRAFPLGEGLVKHAT
jgi:hypothetical protein